MYYFRINFLEKKFRIYFMKTFSNALQTWNIWALNMSRVHPINAWFSSCPRLDKSMGLFGFNAEKKIFKTPINLWTCFLINNNNNNDDDNNNDNNYIFICTAKFGKVFKYALLALINSAEGLYGRILTEVASTDRTQNAVRSVPATKVKILPYRPT